MKHDYVTDMAVEKVPAAVPELGKKTKYMAPHLRSRTENESEENAQIRKRVRGII